MRLLLASLALLLLCGCVVRVCNVPSSCVLNATTNLNPPDLNKLPNLKELLGP